jgi:23S rRNA pseudouridine2605 synthase
MNRNNVDQRFPEDGESPKAGKPGTEESGNHEKSATGNDQKEEGRRSRINTKDPEREAMKGGPRLVKATERSNDHYSSRYTKPHDSSRRSDEHRHTESSGRDRYSNDPRTGRPSDQDRRSDHGQSQRPYEQDRYSGNQRDTRSYDSNRQSDNRPPRPYDSNRQGDNRPPRPYDSSRQGDSRPPRSYDSSRQGDSRPPRSYDSSRNQGDSRPPRSYDSSRNQGDSRPPRSYDSSRNQGDSRPPRSYDSNRQGDSRPPRPYDPNRYQGDSRPPRPYDPNRYQDDSRPPRPYDPNQYQPDSRPPRQYDSNRYSSEPRPSRPYDHNSPYDRGGVGNRYANPQDQGGRSQGRRPGATQIHKLYTPPLHPEGTRINRYIANAGICSRRDADKLVEAGEISVNGVVVSTLGARIDPGDVVAYKGVPIQGEKPQYILLNKPKGYITSNEDPEGRPTVMDLIADACKERLFPVGRLDKMTTGLLLFTNDGLLAEKLMHPRNQVKKLYHIKLNEPLSKEHIRMISQGIKLEDGWIKADQISYVGGVDDRTEIGMEIHSGKNRIVRRIFESFGYDVDKLDRVMFAGLTKKDLRRGKWRSLTPEELNYLKML